MAGSVKGSTPKKPSGLRWKLDQLRLQAGQRMAELDLAHRHAVARRETIAKQYDDRIRNLMHNHDKQNIEVEGMEDVMSEQARRARSGENNTPAKAVRRGIYGRAWEPEAAPVPKVVLSSQDPLLCTPIPKSSAERSLLIARTQEERQRRVREADKDIDELEAKQNAERADLEVVVIDILKVLKSKALNAATEPGAQRAPSPRPFTASKVVDDPVEEVKRAFDPSNPFDEYFDFQFGRLLAMQDGDISVDDEARRMREVSVEVALSAWDIVTGEADVNSVGEAEVGTAMLLYLQAAERHLPQLILKSKALADAALATEAKKTGAHLCKKVETLIGEMLDVRNQVKAHSTKRTLPSHACAKCVMEAMGMHDKTRVGKQVFLAKICGALSSVVCTSRIVRAVGERGSSKKNMIREDSLV
mmetsp:Transcript_2062/g.4823  ORF Transcript_2062/g.4823 Transcript_2062/m.4823 type:complete len:417 (-) Transcript_2062:2-1252(-)